MRRNRRHARSDTPNLKMEIAALERLPIAALRVRWNSKLAREAPPVRSPDTLRRLLAFELQAAVFGGNNAETIRELQKIAKTLERDGTFEPKIRSLRTGAVLTREWNGKLHKVTVLPNGFDYRESHYRSLSNIARLITGTRWSGPRFFGLEQRSVRSRRGHLEHH